MPPGTWPHMPLATSKHSHPGHILSRVALFACCLPFSQCSVVIYSYVICNSYDIQLNLDSVIRRTKIISLAQTLLDLLETDCVSVGFTTRST